MIEAKGGLVSHPYATVVLRDLLQNGLLHHIMCNTHCHSLSGRVVHGYGGGEQGWQRKGWEGQEGERGRAGRHGGPWPVGHSTRFHYSEGRCTNTNDAKHNLNWMSALLHLSSHWLSKIPMGECMAHIDETCCGSKKAEADSTHGSLSMCSPTMSS